MNFWPKISISPYQTAAPECSYYNITSGIFKDSAFGCIQGRLRLDKLYRDLNAAKLFVSGVFQYAEQSRLSCDWSMHYARKCDWNILRMPGRQRSLQFYTSEPLFATHVTATSHSEHSILLKNVLHPVIPALHDELKLHHGPCKCCAHVAQAYEQIISQLFDD